MHPRFVAAPLPDDIRAFIQQHIDSVSVLDVLFVLRRDRERWWPVDDVAALLVSRPTATRGFLAQLTGDGLVEEREGEGLFRYAVPPAQSPTVETLHDLYVRRRPTVIAAIFSAPDEAVAPTPTPAPAQALADAFRLRRRHD